MVSYRELELMQSLKKLYNESNLVVQDKVMCQDGMNKKEWRLDGQ